MYLLNSLWAVISPRPLVCSVGDCSLGCDWFLVLLNQASNCCHTFDFYFQDIYFGMKELWFLKNIYIFPLLWCSPAICITAEHRNHNCIFKEVTNCLTAYIYRLGDAALNWHETRGDGKCLKHVVSSWTFSCLSLWSGGETFLQQLLKLSSDFQFSAVHCQKKKKEKK